MYFDKYQELAGTYSNGKEEKLRLVIAGLGIAGESGEVADIIKKYIGHGHSLSDNKLKKELGDVLWYISEICNLKGWSMSDIAKLNIQKLKDRYPDGFSEERSRSRIEVDK